MPSNVREKRDGKGFDQAVSIRLDPDVVAWIDKEAKENVRNRTQQIEYLMRLGMKMVKERESRESATEGDKQTKQAAG